MPMKTLLYLLLGVMVLVSCNDERKFNRKLDGDWEATVYFGSAPPTSTEYHFHFNQEEKDKSNGYLEIDNGNQRTTLGINYYTNDEQLTMIIDADAYSFDIISFSRSKIELQDSYGQLTVLTKD